MPHVQTLKSLEANIASARAAAMPKGKFRFKSRAQTSSLATTTLPSSSSSLANESAPSPSAASPPSLERLITTLPECTFARASGSVLLKQPDEIHGRDFTLADLQDCTVYLCDIIGT